MIRQDRSLGMYILLSIVTCGIYPLYYIYKLAEDMNIVCDGDGETTQGLLVYFLLSIVTCGIYAWVWFYKLGNRQQTNGRRYNVHIQENGTSILLWMIFGSLLCGIGAFVAWNIIIKNMNTLAYCYNQQWSQNNPPPSPQQNNGYNVPPVQVVQQNGGYNPSPTGNDGLIKMIVIMAAVVVVLLMAAAGILLTTKGFIAVPALNKTTPVPTVAVQTPVPMPVFNHVSASSTRGTDYTSGRAVNYPPEYAVDKDMTTAWAANRNIESNPTFTLSADSKQYVTGIRMTNGYCKTYETYIYNKRITRVMVEYEGGSKVQDLVTDQFGVLQDIRFDAPAMTSYIRIKVLSTVDGKWHDINISEIEVY